MKLFLYVMAMTLFAHTAYAESTRKIIFINKSESKKIQFIPQNWSCIKRPVYVEQSYGMGSTQTVELREEDGLFEGCANRPKQIRWVISAVGGASPDFQCLITYNHSLNARRDWNAIISVEVRQEGYHADLCSSKNFFSAICKDRNGVEKDCLGTYAEATGDISVTFSFPGAADVNKRNYPVETTKRSPFVSSR